ncbi:lycopene cyclase domain-containing protein [Mariniflexile sp. AS56]|uniref:lycopene cyclase domain-containing protein n=1 Tax=Mariniflexile sp. AS56 TaxID=3063957 RepID=UPI0026EEF3DE|nr:lycopene cyclase domain-containing protein [Mariniflexile sp. AS56]MDO7171521.1 lycopene cyclase domain-containing protein [Mariniflexile sp. AS56]
MTYLYLLLNLGSFSIPFIYSFHPKLKFYSHWKSLAIGILISMSIFIPWDVFFTLNRIWGFNSDYFLGYTLFSLPIEEWLFFICIPYACVFTHYALLHYFPNLKLGSGATKLISYILILSFLIISIYNYDKWYTFVNFTLATILTLLVVNKKPELLQSYLLTFLVMLIPFFIVNGVLTGSFITDEVVWYNNTENLNIRLFTIPVEDSVYAFTLILLNLFVIQTIEKPKSR